MEFFKSSRPLRVVCLGFVLLNIMFGVHGGFFRFYSNELFSTLPFADQIQYGLIVLVLKFLLLPILVVQISIKKGLWLDLLSLLMQAALFLVVTSVSEVWNYNSHLFLLQTVLWVHDHYRPMPLEVYVRVLFATLYFQSAISKIVHGLPSGLDSLSQTYLYYFQTLPGYFSLPYTLPVVKLLTVGLILSEFLVFPYLLIKTRYIGFIVCFYFHLATLALLGISFWHLSLFYPLVVLWELRHHYEQTTFKSIGQVIKSI